MFDARRKSTVVKHTITGGTPRGGVYVWSGRTASLTPIRSAGSLEGVAIAGASAADRQIGIVE